MQLSDGGLVQAPAQRAGRGGRLPAAAPEGAGRDPRGAADLGEVLLGHRPGRTVAEAQRTVFKAMGHAMEDLVATDLVLAAARAAAAGPTIDLG